MSSQTVVIVRINAGKGLGNRLANMGLHIGDSIKIVRSGQFGGPIIISINNTEFAIGRGIANKIIVSLEPF
ncbi:ferrous iron transport protein A [candidate division KSB1 bacterium]|nr:ferrous iron transport protein A [candidate division KSB1 bacterium]